MAKKSTSTRLDQIWTYLNPSDMQRQNIEAAMQKNNQNEDAIAAALSLGFWVRGGASEKTRRKAVRASTFLDIVNLKTAIGKVPTILRNNEARTQKELDDNIATLLRIFANSLKKDSGKSNALVTRTTGVATTSMTQGNTQKLMLAKRALDQASEMMTRTWPFLVRAQSPGEARDYYERWFGPYSVERHKTVKGIFNTIHGVLCSGEVCLHLRTTDMVGKPDDTPGALQGSTIEANIQTANGPYALSTLFAWAIPKGTDGKPHVFLCDVFYATNGKGPHDSLKQGEDWSDNIGGVMIHELSHALSRTKDNVHPTFGQACYGRILCSDLALNFPALAVDNADNFEIFCEDIAAL